MITRITRITGIIRIASGNMITMITKITMIIRITRTIIFHFQIKALIRSTFIGTRRIVFALHILYSNS